MFLIFNLEKIFEEVFLLPGLTSNEKNSFDHHNSYNKGPNLAFFCFIESPSNSLPTIKSPKKHIISSYHSNMPQNNKDQTAICNAIRKIDFF
jgi:hypothetical protein